MVAYGMGVLQLIKLLKAVYHDVTQSMYSHDAGYSMYVGNHPVIIQFTKIIRPGSWVLPQTLKNYSDRVPIYFGNRRIVWLASRV